MEAILASVYHDVVQQLEEFDCREKRRFFTSIYEEKLTLLLTFLTYGTNRDLVDFLQKSFGSVLPAGIKDHMIHSLLQKRSPAPLCQPLLDQLEPPRGASPHTFGGRSVVQSPTRLPAKQLLWSASFASSIPSCSSGSAPSNAFRSRSPSPSPCPWDSTRELAFDCEPETKATEGAGDASSNSPWIFHCQDSFPLDSSAAVKSLAISTRASGAFPSISSISSISSSSSSFASGPSRGGSGGAHVHLLTCSPHGTATYSLSADRAPPAAAAGPGSSYSAPCQARNYLAPNSQAPGSPPSPPLQVTVTPHRGVRTPSASTSGISPAGGGGSGLLMWRLVQGSQETAVLALQEGCLCVPAVLVIAPRAHTHSHSGVSGNGPLSYRGDTGAGSADGHSQKMRVHTHSHSHSHSHPHSPSSNAAGAGPRAASSAVVGSSSSSSSDHHHPGPAPHNGSSLASGGGGKVSIAAVISCDASPDGSALCLLVEGRFLAGHVDLSTRPGSADGESDVDSEGFSVGSAGRCDLLEMRYRIRSGTRQGRSSSSPSHNHRRQHQHQRRARASTTMETTDGAESASWSSSSSSGSGSGSASSAGDLEGDLHWMTGSDDDDDDMNDDSDGDGDGDGEARALRAPLDNYGDGDGDGDINITTFHSHADYLRSYREQVPGAGSGAGAGVGAAGGGAPGDREEWERHLTLPLPLPHRHPHLQAAGGHVRRPHQHQHQQGRGRGAGGYSYRANNGDPAAAAAAAAAAAPQQQAGAAQTTNGNSGNGWESDQSHADEGPYETSLLTAKRRYYVVFCRVLSGSVSVHAVASLQSGPQRQGRTGPCVSRDISGLHLDQLPCLVRCVSGRLCIVAGTCGLLALVSAGGITCDGAGRGQRQSQFFSLTCDDFVPSTSIPSSSSSSSPSLSAPPADTSRARARASSGSGSGSGYPSGRSSGCMSVDPAACEQVGDEGRGRGRGRSTDTEAVTEEQEEEEEGQESGRRFPSHASNVTVHAVDFVLQSRGCPSRYSGTEAGTGTEAETEVEIAIASADSAGVVAMWHVRLCLSPSPSPQEEEEEEGGCGAHGYGYGYAAVRVLNSLRTPRALRVYGTPHRHLCPVGPPLRLPLGRTAVCSLVLAPSGGSVVACVGSEVLHLALQSGDSGSGSGSAGLSLCVRRVLHSEPDGATAATAAAAVGSHVKFACAFESEALLLCRVSSLPASPPANPQFDRAPMQACAQPGGATVAAGSSSSGSSGSGVRVDCWSMPSPDSFESRVPEAGELARAASGLLPPAPAPAPAPLLRSGRKDLRAHSTYVSVPVPLSSPISRFAPSTTTAVQQQPQPQPRLPPPKLPLSALAQANAHARLSPLCAGDIPATWRAPALPVLLPLAGWSCEDVLAAIFGHTHSAAFADCVDLLSVLLASLAVTAGPFVPAGSISKSWALNCEPRVDPNQSGPSVGLVAAALDVDVSAVHNTLCCHYGALRHLLQYNPPLDCRVAVSDPWSASASPALPDIADVDMAVDAPAASGGDGSSTRARSSAGSGAAAAASSGASGMQPCLQPNSPSDAHRGALCEAELRPTELLLRGGLAHYLCSTDAWRLGAGACVGALGTAAGGGGSSGALSGWSACSTGGGSFWVNQTRGHDCLSALFLKNCGNKSVAMEHRWQDYLREFGPQHFRRCGRGLRELTRGVRKIDETAGLKDTLPRQLGFVSGLQEIYARRVGLSGRLPDELCMLQELRVLSMGNNNLAGHLPPGLGALPHLQRIVLHQNNLSGSIPAELASSGCIVNLAGNSNIDLGPDVPDSERSALHALYSSTAGDQWGCRTHWCDGAAAVQNWYKVGTLAGHVHSLVMSSNGMRGKLPDDMSALTSIRMIELATMPDLAGGLNAVCSLLTLRRLCVCRCSLSGPIPEAIGRLLCLEELQLFGNKLSGAIPDSLGELRNLKLLSLGEYTGGNNFSPAPLPACIRRLKSLEALFISSCNVNSEIPSWIGELRALRQLDLQHNDVCGELPASLANLSNLLYLNFKDNSRLGGVLPVGPLSNLRLLNRLSLVNTDIMSSPTLIKQLQRALPRCKIWN